MKKTLICLLSLILLLAIPFSATHAAETPGDLLITSEPIEGGVGDIVRVNFYLYPNLPDGLKLNSISCMIKFDPEFLKFGTINQIDEEANLESLMKGKSSLFLHNEPEPGLLKLAFSDGYGIEKEGFWFQAEFRIEKEGATDFVFNGFSYSAISDETGKMESFYIDPVSVGGVYTSGEAVPTDGAANETFAPLSPSIETPAASTPTPKPVTTPGQTVPVTTTLPTFSALPSATSGPVTKHPQVTPTPAPSRSSETDAPASGTPETTTPVTSAPATEAPASSEPTGSAPVDTEAPASSEPTEVPETTEAPEQTPATIPISDETPEPTSSEHPSEGGDAPAEGTMSTFAKIAIIGGIAALIGVGILLIVLILKRRSA